MAIGLKIIQNLTMREIEEIKIESQLGTQITNQEIKDSGCSFIKITSMRIYFYKTKEINGSNYVKIPIRSSCILNIENEDKYCFLRGFLAHLHPSQYSHPKRVSNYERYFIELKIDGFHFTNGFRTCDVVNFEKRNNLCNNFFEILFHEVTIFGNIN